MSQFEEDVQSDTLMGALARRLQEITVAQVLPLRVPRWSDPKVVVSYEPLENSEVHATLEKAAEAPGDPAEARLNGEATLLVKACIGIDLKWETEPPKELAHIPTHFDSFGPELAEVLGIDKPTAVKTVRKLFLTDGDLLRHSRELAGWSASANERIREDFSEK